MRADVVVVGAGLSGLTAARELTRAGLDVVVLEARNRVGGRTYTAEAGGVPLEMGGQWAGPAQPRVLALAREVGVEAFPADVPGRTVFVENGARSEYEDRAEEPPFGSSWAEAELERASRNLAALARSVPADAPWEAERAEEWDGMTLESWKRESLASASARSYFDLSVESLYACEPREISLLGVLADIAASGTYAGLFEIESSAEEYRLAGGAQELCVRLAAQLGDRVLVGRPVRRVSQDTGAVEVEADGLYVQAEAVVVTVPPALRARLRYEPPLPALHDGLSQRMPMGAVIKCHAVYERPFWREAGLSGRAESGEGPVGITCDNSWPHGAPGGDKGVLTGFVLGAEARRWGHESPERRRSAVLDSLARYFGKEALAPVAYAELDWSAEVYTRGGYGGYASPGMLTDHGPALTEPFGRIHWAGSETAVAWAGYMEGAVESGERAAARIKELLSGSRAENGRFSEATTRGARAARSASSRHTEGV